jgi:putative flippase GtrA
MDLTEVFGSRVARQFLRFSAVGVVATGVHYGILVGLVEAFHIHPLLATSLGFIAGALVSYTLNRVYTFSSSAFAWTALAKYYGVTTLGMVLNGAIVAFLLGWGVYYLVAQVAATAVVLISNFLSARLVVFRDIG